jgi:hypothetical protein
LERSICRSGIDHREPHLNGILAAKLGHNSDPLEICWRLYLGPAGPDFYLCCEKIPIRHVGDCEPMKRIKRGAHYG